MRYSSHSRRGVALLFSLAILAVLAILASTFVRLMIMEHSAATNYVAAERARKLADAGMQYAIGKLRHLARDVHWSRFEDYWLYKTRIYDSGGVFAEDIGAGLPIESAVYPPGAKTGPFPHVYGAVSWYKGNTAVPMASDPIVLTYPVAERVSVYNPAIAANGAGRPISGWIGSSDATSFHRGPHGRYVAGTNENWGDTFALKVLDTASQVNVNMDSAFIVDFLNYLGEEIDNYFRTRFTSTGVAIPRSLTELAQFGYKELGFRSKALGSLLITGAGGRNSMPGRVFQSKEEILHLFKKLYPDLVAVEEYNKVTDFITLYSYRDRTVLHPGTLMTSQLYEARGTGPKWKEARSPLNMNTVSNPVLVAWLRGISYHKYIDGSYAGVVRINRFALSGLRELAFHFRQVTYRDPLLAWKGLKALLHVKDAESGGTKNKAPFQAKLAGLGWDKWDRDAWLAMADPNTTLNKFNPDDLVRREVDKYDLATWTTEMTFNSMGYYEVQSLGTITNQGGQIVSQKKLRGVYRIFDQIYKTTQRDFELSREKLGIDAKSGSTVRLYDEDYWGVISYPEYRNKFLEYKETSAKDTSDAKRYGYAALYDGKLSFNALTRETSYDGDFIAGFNYPQDKHLEATKNEMDGFKPTGAAGYNSGTARAITAGRGSARLRMASGTPETARVGGDLSRFNGGSDGFNMGFYTASLRGRFLSFPGSSVSNGKVGAVEFWVKPRYARSVGKETWWYWADSKDRIIWVYREGTSVVVWWSIGNVTDSDSAIKDKTLRYDASFWKAGEWHHIHVDWGADGNEEGVDDSTGKKNIQGTGRLFVDGDESDMGGVKGDTEKGHPEARHMDFGGWPPKTQAAMDVWMRDPGAYSSQISWVEKHIPRAPSAYNVPGTHAMQVGGGKSIPLDSNGGNKVLPAGNATIDNVIVTSWRVFQKSTVTFQKTKIPVRYFAKKYRGYSRMYWQDITSEFTAVASRDIQLGTIAWTNHHGIEGFIKVYVAIGTASPKEAPGG